jgi:cytochrome c-type biogenesis protein CcmH/NrfF
MPSKLRKLVLQNQSLLKSNSMLQRDGTSMQLHAHHKLSEATSDSNLTNPTTINTMERW